MVDVNISFLYFVIVSMCVSVTSLNISKQQYTNLRIFDTFRVPRTQAKAGKFPPSHVNSWSVAVGNANLGYDNPGPLSGAQKTTLNDGEIVEYTPGSQAPHFTIWGINGKVVYPSKMFSNSPIIVHVFDPYSGFVECMWTSKEGLKPLVTSGVLNSTHFIFVPKSAEMHELYGASWMRDRIRQTLRNIGMSRADDAFVMEKIHISVVPLDKLGNWIPDALSQWHCVDHLCGYDQVVVRSNASQFPVVGKRLDARYDWLPSPSSVFGNKTLSMVRADTGCESIGSVKGSIALVTSGNCSFFQKVQTMQRSGAIGVVVFSNKTETVQELTCDNQCDTPLSIPATMVEYSGVYTGDERLNISFQNTPSENFFLSVDQAGKLAEVGWFLYPSVDFLVWQAQWFEYRAELDKKLQTPATIVSIFTEKIMQGKQGVVVNVTLPDLTDLQKFSKMELDMSLSCPGTMDTECPHWDHTINLYVCCDPGSPLCGMELGRWISAFRRRIGRWTTDVSPLLPLLTSSTCVFNMKTEPWAMPWKPSLNLRFSQPRGSGDMFPAKVTVLYEPGATFDKSYNSHFKSHKFTVPNDVKRVEVFAVITGHGSDENGCGEFCVTSHHFKVNKHVNNITFSNAGTPLGCADQVPHGVEPNEHGTWLYGRNGWCDGQNVLPWVIDVTDQLGPPGTDNVLSYFGWYNGTDPNPKQNPGIIILYSYLVYYKEFIL
ncbi:LOW QUALITY PROTEIN: uncharacterized protein LOC117318180 [Pecten maximus]|uniref:LOW QUALITY PROTEIN: uncharacterized protein LOC117318180 n=1 Tax=Pecten maximus TaxID=6579 RepID=UPI00145850E7|nr:LOW QUALITY PROTEIN: uncharacterized protein LOC117318180 [Pecten maximus]